MMLLDVAPPDFEVVDAWSPVADGPFGVMGCHRPAHVRHVYAGADALAVDEVVLGDLGVEDPRLAPIVRRAHHWFGLPLLAPRRRRRSAALALVVARARTHRHHSAILGAASYPVYMYLSNHGELFVPAMDTVAFPPTRTRGSRNARCAVDLATSLRAPASITMTPCAPS